MSSVFLRLSAGGALFLAPLSGCGNGNGNNDIVVSPMIKATFSQTSPTQADRVVFLDNVTAAGDAINADVVVQDSTGTLDVDDIDLVLRYDATFLQMTTLRPETLFGNCGSVNAACLLVSPVCVNNLAAANGGGERYCRGNGSTFCTQDTDCTAPNDACGNFGRLKASFAVIVGPKTCSNKTSQPCAQSSDCKFCTSNPAQACVNAGSCSGICSAFVCSGGSFDGRACATGADCIDQCGTGICSGCPAVLVNGKRLIVNLTMRVVATGTSEVRFVVSSNPLAPASFLRNGTLELSGVQFWPSVDSVDPAMGQGSFTVMGTK